jgi:hypothetical protein
MTYMAMLPIVAELTTTWKWHDAAARTSAERAEAQKKIAGLMARLPPKESVPFHEMLESAAESYAALTPIVKRVQELETQEGALQAEIEGLQKAASVKWGPKKTATGETQDSLRKKLEPVRKELDDLMEKVTGLEEVAAPLIDELKILDRLNRNRADVAAWTARGRTGPVPACIQEHSIRWAEEFLATSVVVGRLPVRRPALKEGGVS